MRDLNVDFDDLYKRVDRFLRDAYRSEKGVGEYLSQMQVHDLFGRRVVPGWAADREMLYRLRKKRNLLSHEVSFDEDLCTPSEYAWLELFYSRLKAAEDPLAQMLRADAAERQKRALEERRRAASARETSRPAPAPGDILFSEYPKRRKPLSERLRSFFKRKKER